MIKNVAGLPTQDGHLISMPRTLAELGLGVWF